MQLIMGRLSFVSICLSENKILLSEFYQKKLQIVWINGPVTEPSLKTTIYHL